MGDLTFICLELTDVRHRFSEMVKITGGRDAWEYRYHLRQMAELGMSVWLAERAGRIVGSIGFTTAPGQSGFTSSPEFAAASSAVGVSPDEVHVRSLIYVDPSCRGLGISNELEARVNETSRALGFGYYAAFAYETDEVFRWIHRRSGALELEIADPMGTGYPVTLVPFGGL